MSMVATNVMRMGAVILFAFVMVILNLLSESGCNQLLKVKGEKERELANLEESRRREATRWEGMKTPEHIEMALLKHGLSMKLPRANQTIRMKTDGQPYPGQLAVQLAMQTVAAPKTAQYRRSSAVRPTSQYRRPKMR